jgi:predicted permease
VLADLRFAFRLIAKDRWFSAAAIAALALGIGVNAIGFTIVNAAFLRGLPVADADRIYLLGWMGRRVTRTLSHVELVELREASRTMSGLGAFRNNVVNLSDARALPDQLRGTWITANAFGILGEQPVLGRDFAPGDDRPGAEPVAIIGYDVWKRRYNGDPNVLGTSVRLNGQPATIVGVMPSGSEFPDNTDVWIPFIPGAPDTVRTNRTLNVFGRLRNDVSPREAQAEMSGISQRLETVDAGSYEGISGLQLQTFTERYVGGPAKRVFIVMMGAVCFVLLIACANVANLVLSRSAHRSREIAVRIAMGATRWRVVRQLLLEAVVFGVIGGSIGLMLATGAAKVIDAAVQDPDKPYWIVFSVDYTVFAYVAAVCVLTGVLFGLAPALHVSKTNINDVLKEAGRGSVGGGRTRWFSSSLVVFELALTMALLAGAGLMVRSFLKLYSLDVGIRTEHLLTMRVRLPATQYPDAEARRAFYGKVEPRVASIPGIEAVAITTAVPPSGSRQRSIEIEGRPADAADGPMDVSSVTISPRFFEVAGVSLRRGRSFDPRDGGAGLETVIINEQVAKDFFRGEDPIGQRLRFAMSGTPGQPLDVWRTIVGISPSIRQGSSRTTEPTPAVYLPYRQDPPEGAALLVRSQLAPGSVMEAIRRAVQAIDQDQPVFTIQTLDEMLAQDRWPFRVFGGLFAIFAVIALVLSSVGLYAVMAYSVAQRTQEIGVRMALGAAREQVAWLVLRRGIVQLAIGLTVGLAGALALSRLLGSVIVQVTPTDPLTFIGITLLLTSVSIAACLIPARRATRIDPLVALRAE